MKRSTESSGILLAGGLSSRMGRDKALLSLRDETNFLQRSYRKLSRLCERVYVSIREEQRQIYSEYIPSGSLVSDSMEKVQGPLCGILSAYSLARSEGNPSSFLVLAVDMPHLKPKTLLRLLVYGKDSKDGAFYRTEAGIEPLCGLYRSEFLASILARSRKEEGISFSPKELLEEADLSLFEIPVREKRGFSNLNTPKDLLGF
ncbi:molybdenum cofactor guanylyltransferase [Leptospira langatensis]|uniref:Probable molybdenum cofactor guanylyltransferase n=1 Tax=Leptospira langatensis TaxID=2484983 RepID=A0A5F1ZRB7_9LEPT|nr:molybdenum cofactor guanylyltransferase [Leptospira langatensis]TGK05490.1 molybdenum cofactor guanylyltransferase [Leptospira langatensis]TGL38626.1 molybdenum cofactor guanylyltransferase [Leptospira langatensis]